MKIVKNKQFQMKLPLVSAFKTSYGERTEKLFDLFLLEDEKGYQGVGELVSFEQADYIEETLRMSRQILIDELIPCLFRMEFSHPQEIWQAFQPIQGNFMAKSALETAVWDLYARREKISLQNLFSATKESVSVGVSMGIQPDATSLLQTAQSYVDQGYERIKLKIAPGNDLGPLRELRAHFPDLQLMADANSAYTLADWQVFKEMDQLKLSMIEQPFHPRDYVDHGELQKRLKTPICLDENIRSLEDVKTAHALKSCQAINLKIPRVGGITEARRIMDFCQQNQLLVWLGGMFESGVGRALNLHLASQSLFTFPGDLSAYDRYFYDDVVDPKAVLENGKLKVPKKHYGIGVTLEEEKIKKYCYKELIYKPKEK